MFLKSGHQVSHVTGKELEKLSEGFQCRKKGLVRLNPGGWIHYTSFLNVADPIYDFKLKPSDVTIMTYPKTGTTWMQEIVWTMRNNLSFDHPEAGTRLGLRSPFLEGDLIYGLPYFENRPPETAYLNRFKELCPNGNPEKNILLQMAECLPDPRIIKTHLPFSLLPPKILDTSKVVYVARNPMDTCVSYCHFLRLMKLHSYSGGLDNFFDFFIRDELNWSPYWTHLKEAWQRRDNPNLLFCFYEDMKENPSENLLKIGKFLNIELNDDQIKKVLHYTNIDSMRNRGAFLGETDDKSSFVNEQVYQKDGGVFRRGIAGDWKKKLTKEQIERMKEWSLLHLKEIDDSDAFISKWFRD